MGDHHAGHAHGAFKFDDQFVDAIGADGVKPGGWLVVQDHAGWRTIAREGHSSCAWPPDNWTGSLCSTPAMSTVSSAGNLVAPGLGVQLSVLDEGKRVLFDCHGIEQGA